MLLNTRRTNMENILKSLKDAVSDLGNLSKSGKMQTVEEKITDGGCKFAEKGGDYSLIMDRISANLDESAIISIAKELHDKAGTPKELKIEEAKETLFNFVNNGGTLNLTDPGFFQGKYTKVNGKWFSVQDLGLPPTQIL